MHPKTLIDLLCVEIDPIQDRSLRTKTHETNGLSLESCRFLGAESKLQLPQKLHKGEKEKEWNLMISGYLDHANTTVYIYMYICFQEFPNQPKPALYHYLGASSKWIMFDPNIVFNSICTWRNNPSEPGHLSWFIKTQWLHESWSFSSKHGKRLVVSYFQRKKLLGDFSTSRLSLFNPIPL